MGTALPTWNLMGMMNNPWFRVKVSKVAGNDNEIWFEHPTRVEPTPGTFYPNGEYMHLVNGEVASPGWAERLHKDYSAAYAPKEKNRPGRRETDLRWEDRKSSRARASPQHYIFVVLPSMGGRALHTCTRGHRRLCVILRRHWTPPWVRRRDIGCASHEYFRTSFSTTQNN